MAEMIQETVTTQTNPNKPVVVAPVKIKTTGTQTLDYLVYFILGVVEILLAFRLILKLMGASTTSGFVNFIYALSGILIMPFEGIFSRMFAQGLETTSVLEPSTIVAMIVYAVVAWGVVKLIYIASGEQEPAE